VLFYPTTARIKEHLSDLSAANDTGFSLEAVDLFATRGSNSARVQVYDTCVAGTTPAVQVMPEAALGSVEKQGPRYVIKLNPSMVPLSINSIEVTVQSCLAANLSSVEVHKKGYLQVVRIPIVPAASDFSVLAPTEIPAGDTHDYDVRVFDKCPPESEGPAISSYPPQALAKPVRDKAAQWFKATLNANNLTTSKDTPFIGDIRLLIRSCQAAALSEADAKAAGLMKEVSVRVGYRMLRTTFNIWASEDAEQEFGKAFSQSFIATDVVFENPNTKPVIVYGSSLSAKLRFLASVDDVKATFGKDIADHPSRLDHLTWGNRSASDALDFKELYRPLAYTDVLAIFTYQQQSDPRQQTMGWLKSAGELAAGGAVFLTARDYLKGVGLFTGILVPELEKRLLWDMILHVKNLQERGLKEVEEIPEHGQLRRVVFFPRRALPEFLPPFPMYIAEIRPDETPVTAVLVDKQAAVPSGPGN